MAQAIMTVRLDTDKKVQFENLCKDFGMSANTAFTIFVNSVIRNQGIPFPIATSKPNVGLQALEALRQQAVDSGAAGMSLEEINEEIRASREGR